MMVNIAPYWTFDVDLILYAYEANARMVAGV
jgi:hypothetical protein